MTETVQINPAIAATTKALLVNYCKERKAKQGDVVDAALVAFLTPGSNDNLDLMYQKVNALDQGMGLLLGTLDKLVKAMEAMKAPPAPPKIATKEDIYGDRLTAQPLIVAPVVAPATDDPPPGLGRHSWRGLFGRK